MGSFRISFVVGLIALSLGHVSGTAKTSGIFFRHFNRDGSHNDVNINYADQLKPELDLDECTVFHLHGYTETVESRSVTIITDGYLQHTNCNVIAIDYRQVADNVNYFADAIHVDDVGKAIANFLNQLVENGLNPDKIHIIGHSLGAQVAGHVGSHTNFRIAQITGLDPAGPMFFFGSYLKSGDAGFVVIIHTDEGAFGQTHDSGDANFHPNGGHRPQPGCPFIPFVKTKANDSNCDHHRSWRYFAESIGNPDGFMAIECSNGLEFDFGKCNRSHVVPMGYATPTSARGKFYLRTNSQTPFAKGMQGIL